MAAGPIGLEEEHSIVAVEERSTVAVAACSMIAVEAHSIVEAVVDYILKKKSNCQHILNSANVWSTFSG